MGIHLTAKDNETVPVLDFGSQYAMLIARRLREAQVYSQVVPHDISAGQLRRINPKGLVLSGGPGNVYAENAPQCDPAIFELGIPILGICYGLQVACSTFNGTVHPSKDREYGRRNLRIRSHDELFHGLDEEMTVWMSHGDRIEVLPEGFETLASTDTCPHAAVKDEQGLFWGLQFHPEVTHTPAGNNILHNFLYRICRCKGEWEMSSFIGNSIEKIKREVSSDSRVVLGLSGGVDSSVAAVLLHRAIGKRLHCIYVDNGVMRANETVEVEKKFREHLHINLRVIDASGKFLDNLQGVTDPEEKRKIIGRTFIDVFKDAAEDIENAKYLAQGTLYPDVIESAGISTGPASVIKTHHNVGGLPAELGFDLIEPFRFLFKDEVRKVGEALGVPHEVVWRHPFPGPGLSVRILGEVTRERLRVLREADRILLDELVASGYYDHVGQAFAVLLPLRSVGVMGDERTYDHVIAIRVVETEDFMTADWARLPGDLLAAISNRIINCVQGVNRVVYDISSKPPATIEWE